MIQLFLIFFSFLTSKKSEANWYHSQQLGEQLKRWRPMTDYGWCPEAAFKSPAHTGPAVYITRAKERNFLYDCINKAVLLGV